MKSKLPRFRSLFLSCQQQKNTKNGAAVTSLRSFLFHEDFRMSDVNVFVLSVLQILTPFRIRTLDPRHRRRKRLKNLNSGTLKKTDLCNHSNMCQRDSNTSWPAKCHVKTESVSFILLLQLSSIKNSTEQDCN